MRSPARVNLSCTDKTKQTIEFKVKLYKINLTVSVSLDRCDSRQRVISFSFFFFFFFFFEKSQKSRKTETIKLLIIRNEDWKNPCRLEPVQVYVDICDKNGQTDSTSLFLKAFFLCLFFALQKKEEKLLRQARGSLGKNKVCPVLWFVG